VGPLDSASQVFGPTCAHRINLGTIASAAEVFAPSILLPQYVFPDFIGSTAELYPPRFDGSLPAPVFYRRDTLRLFYWFNLAEFERKDIDNQYASNSY